MRALIDEDFKPVPLKLSNENKSAVCGTHSEEVCKACKVDFTALNALARILESRKDLAIPPPPNVVNPNRSQMVTKSKDEGNVRGALRAAPCTA